MIVLPFNLLLTKINGFYFLFNERDIFVCPTQAYVYAVYCLEQCSDAKVTKVTETK